MRPDQLDQREFFTEAYGHDFTYVYSYIFARTAGNRQLAEDIAQETFAAAWSSLDRFDRKSSFRTWLCAISKNKLREHYRRSIRKETFELPDAGELAEQDSGFDLEQRVLGNETRLTVLEALGSLNPPYKYALIMKYLDGLSVKEIAAATGRSAKAVDGLLQRAKAAFEKAYLTTEGKEDE